MKVEEMQETLLQMGVSEKVIGVMTAFNGYNKESFEFILFYTFGYRNFEQLED